MERTPALMIEAWREVARHLGLQVTLDALAPRLAEHLPGVALLVRALDAPRRAADTLGCVGARAGTPRDVLGPREWEALLAWSAGGELLQGSARELRARLGPLVPSALEGPLVLGCLRGASAPEGVALFAAAPGTSFGPAQGRQVRALLEPLAAAVANERHGQELVRLREAAEADRRALLARLGRRDIAETIVGAEGGLGSVMERVALVADSDVPVLLLGETGSGKEVVARALRGRSRRASGPFVRVNCGAIPAGLIDSELFGHERGSFSGATAQRRGWFERADGGTLFLDEVGALPLEAQVRLLRVLQDGAFERVGGEQPVQVDVRVIAATHQDLRAMVGAGRFREDLWYRLAVFPIQIPPLRDRPQDIPALALHFALRSCERFGTRPLAPTEADLELLARYDWPGNVRELQAVLDRAVILGGGDRLELDKALGVQGPARTGAPPGNGGGTASGPLLTLDRAMAQHIEAALARCHGRIEGAKGAAQLLAINPHTLRARMRKLGVSRSASASPRTE